MLATKGRWSSGSAIRMHVRLPMCYSQDTTGQLRKSGVTIPQVTFRYGRFMPISQKSHLC